MVQRLSKIAPPGKLATAPRAAEVGALIGEMMSHIHRRSAGDTLAIMNEIGLTMAQLVTLHLLDHAGTRSISAIAACLRLSPAATSHLVDRMHTVALVERIEDPSDRRQKRVSITAAGRRLVDRVQRERSREIAEVVARLSAEVRGQFSRVLVRVIKELSLLPQDVP
jgi:DNA-binding MarR family transcriptional regulator